MAGLSVKLGMA